MNILVTGGAGFIGSHLADKLIAKNHRVIIVDDLSTGKRANINPKAKFYKIKIQSSKLSPIFKKEKPEIIFHLAAQMDVRKSITQPLFDAETNILGSINLIENSVKHKAKKFIFISSGGAIYGDEVKIPTPEESLELPISPYGIAKLTVEKYLYYYNHQYRLPSLNLRLANIYGPRQDSMGEAGVVAIFCGQLKKSKALSINGSGKQTRDFVYVADVVLACLKSLVKKAQGTFNIGTAEETDINHLAKKLMQISQVKVRLNHRPAILGEQLRSCLNNKKARQFLNWQAEYDLDKGLKETWEWFQGN
jgi:UDP-glucose 4-epimerase